MKPVAVPRQGLLLSAFLCVCLVGCAGQTPAPVVERPPTPMPPPADIATKAPAVPTPAPGKDGYVVKKGDTLYSIALDHGLDYKDLAAWNSLENPNRIRVGQMLRIVAPGEPAATAPVAVAVPIVGSGVVEKRALEGSSDSLKREPKAGKEPYSDDAYARALQAAPTQLAKAEPRPDVKAGVQPENKAEAHSEAKPPDVVTEPGWLWPANGKLLASFNEATNKGLDIGGKAGDPVIAVGDGKVVYSGTGLRGYGQLVIVKHNAELLSAYAHNSKILVKEGQSVSRGQKIAEMGNTDADQVMLHFEVRRQGKPVDPLKYLPGR